MEEFIKALGYDPEKIKTVDDFKAAVSADFVRRSEAHNDDELTGRIVGKSLKQIEKAFFSDIKDLGIELGDDDLKDAKQTYDKIKIGLSKVKEHHSSTVKGLQELAEKKGGDASKEWQEKYGKAEQRAADNEGLVKTLQQQIKEKEDWAKNQIKSFKINDAKKNAFGKVQFKDGLTELERVGFEHMFNSKYEIDLDDKESPFIYEKETKKRIDNKAVVGTFMGIEDVLKMEIDANKLGKSNPHAGSTVIKKPDNPFDPSRNGVENKGGAKISSTFFEK